MPWPGQRPRRLAEALAEVKGQTASELWQVAPCRLGPCRFLLKPLGSVQPPAAPSPKLRNDRLARRRWWPSSVAEMATDCGPKDKTKEVAAPASAPAAALPISAYSLASLAYPSPPAATGVGQLAKRLADLENSGGSLGYGDSKSGQAASLGADANHSLLRTL